MQREEGRKEDFSASEILHLGSVSERRDGDRYSDFIDRMQSLSLVAY